MVVTRKYELGLAILVALICVGSSTYTPYSNTTYNSLRTAPPAINQEDKVYTGPTATMRIPVGVDSSNGDFYFRNNNVVTGASRVDYYYRLHLTTSTWTTDNHWAEWIYASSVSTEDDALAYDISPGSLSLVEMLSASTDTFQLMIGVDLNHFYYSPAYALPNE